MTLKEQVINKVQLMPDEQMKQLVPFVDFLLYSWRQTAPEGTAAAAKGTNRRNLKGIMPGKVIMATAAAEGLTLVTCDDKLRLYKEVCQTW